MIQAKIRMGHSSFRTILGHFLKQLKRNIFIPAYIFQWDASLACWPGEGGE